MSSSQLCRSLCQCSLVFIAWVVPPPSTFTAETWQSLDLGLEVASFKIAEETPAGDSVLTVLRADPEIWELSVLTDFGSGHSFGKSAKQWCQEHNLVAVTNAGMFHPNQSHVGYLKIDGEVVQASRNKYQSAFATDPVDSNQPSFRIFDLDETSLNSISQEYKTVCQNLRLIKRDCENRWSAQDKIWSEAAIAEDESGNILVIFSRSPYSMVTFNQILCALPLDLVTAQHLEGGPEAQLYIKCADREIDLVGSFETGFNESDHNTMGWSVPTVMGLRRK